MSAILVSSILLLLVLGFPIFLTLVMPTVAALFAMPSINPAIIPQRMVGGLDNFSIMAVPYFMYCADIMSEGEIGKRLIALTRTWLGHVPGGLSVATVATCLIFGAISGAGAAAVVAVGGLVFGLMRAGQYNENFAVGLILSSSTLAMLIPPSIAYVLYATITGASIQELFLSGLQVGLIVGGVFIAYSVFDAKRKNVPLMPKVPWDERWKALRDAKWALGLIVVILGGIYGGVFTPTEAASVAAVYACFVEVCIYRSLTIRQFLSVSAKSGKTIAMLMILIAAGSVLSWIITVMQIPQALIALFGGSSQLTILLFINLVFLIAGMFVDPNSAIIVLTPLVYPLAVSVGIDPIHLASLIVLNLAIGMLTPPFGLNLFVGTKVFNKPFSDVIDGSLRFIVIMVILLGIVTFIPATSLLLPNLLLR